MIDDFVRRLKDDLSKRAESYTEKLIAAQASEHDRLVGHIRAIKETRSAIDMIARDFLVEERASK